MSPFRHAIHTVRHGPVFSKLFSFFDRLGHLVMQRFRKPETGDPADHRQYSHYQ